MILRSLFCCPQRVGAVVVVDVCPECTFACFETHKIAHDLEELVWLS